MGKNQRYPGVYSFDKDQTAIFFGRKDEIKELQTKIDLEQKILLYSKSGLGKTSILRAGLMPKLSTDYRIIYIEFGNYNKDLESEKHVFPVDKISSEIKKLPEHKNAVGATVFEQLVQEKPKRTIWFDLKLLQLSNPKQLFLFVFDQFEQLFTYPEDEINRFVDQFQEFLSDRIPDMYYDIIEKEADNNEEFLQSEEYKLLQQKMSVKAIFSIRKDYLSFMNYLSRKIPDIQNVFYELMPLDEQQATNAIKKPANVSTNNFFSPVFEFDDLAIQKIIDELSSHGKNDIDTTQLQIVCKSIEDSLISIINNETDRNPLITGFDFIKGGSVYKLISNAEQADFRDVFKRYYNDSINALPADVQDKIKKLIENDLIKNQMRIPQDQHYFLDHPEIDTPDIIEYLDLLVDKHLLRKESHSTGRISYELSHDTLINSILEEKEKRGREEERIKRDAQIKIELEKKKRDSERKHQEELLRVEKEKRDSERKHQEELLSVERDKIASERIHQEKLLKLEKEKLKAQEEKTRQVKKSRKIFIGLFILLLIISSLSVYYAARLQNEKRQNNNMLKTLTQKEEETRDLNDELIEAMNINKELKSKENKVKGELLLLKKREKLISEIILAGEQGNLETLSIKLNELKKMSNTDQIKLIEAYIKTFNRAKALEADESTWHIALKKYDEAIALEVPDYLAKERKNELNKKIKNRVNEYIELATKYKSYGGSFAPAACDRFVKPGLALDPGNAALKNLYRELKCK